VKILKNFSTIGIAFFVISIFASSLWAGFGSEIGSDKPNRRLSKEEKAKPELENKRINEPREKPEREKQERVEPEYKKWWQWELEQKEQEAASD